MEDLVQLMMGGHVLEMHNLHGSRCQQHGSIWMDLIYNRGDTANECFESPQVYSQSTSLKQSV